MNNYLAFDLEIATSIPDGEPDWKKFRPLGISCFATAEQDGARAGHGWVFDPLLKEPLFAPRMSYDEAVTLVEHLEDAVMLGFTILTWNGLGFDFDVLAEESGLHDRCVALALASVDPMFQVFCQKGFPLGLDTAAKGMGLEGKTEGMHGDLAPVMWQNKEYDKVLAYVKQDTKVTLDVALAIERERHLFWTSKSGRAQRLYMHKLLTVQECLALPLPDQSWMSDPWPRSKFTGWMGGKQ